MPYLEEKHVKALDRLDRWRSIVTEQESWLESAFSSNNWATVRKAQDIDAFSDFVQLPSVTKAALWTIREYHPQSDPMVLQDVCDIVVAAHEYKDAARLPPMKAIHRRIDRSMTIVQLTEAAIYRFATPHKTAASSIEQRRMLTPVEASKEWAQSVSSFKSLAAPNGALHTGKKRGSKSWLMFADAVEAHCLTKNIPRKDRQ